MTHAMPQSLDALRAREGRPTRWFARARLGLISAIRGLWRRLPWLASPRRVAAEAAPRADEFRLPEPPCPDGRPAAALWDRPLAALTAADLLAALERSWCLHCVVPRTLDLLAADPLASAGHFRGDLLRGLLEVPTTFWSRHPRLYARYRDALRAGALARRALPLEERLDFWIGCSCAGRADGAAARPSRVQPSVAPDPDRAASRDGAATRLRTPGVRRPGAPRPRASLGMPTLDVPPHESGSAS
jgi:hypothetical protein